VKKGKGEGGERGGKRKNLTSFDLEPVEFFLVTKNIISSDSRVSFDAGILPVAKGEKKKRKRGGYAFQTKAVLRCVMSLCLYTCVYLFRPEKRREGGGEGCVL